MLTRAAVLVKVYVGQKQVKGEGQGDHQSKRESFTGNHKQRLSKFKGNCQDLCVEHFTKM